MGICAAQFPLTAHSDEQPSQAPAPAPAAAPARPTAPPPTFAVLEFQVDGNTVLPAIDIERAVTPYLGEGKTIKDVEAARGKLEGVYHERGYKTVLVDIPPQQVTEGIVRLHVVEGSVGKLKIVGSKYHSLDAIRDKVAQLNPGAVPNFSVVQSELGDVNRSPDLHVTPVLRASETPGKVDVDLQVEDALPLHYLLEVNNRYSANTAHIRDVGELRYDNLFQSNQSLSLQYQTAAAEPENAKIFSASYVIPTSGGSVWALYYIHSNSNVASVGSIDVIGNGSIYGAHWINPLPTRDPLFFHSFTAGVDYKDFGQNVQEGSGGGIESPVAYTPFTFEYSATWLGTALATPGRRAATTYGRSSTSFDITADVLLEPFGGDWQQFAQRRANASPDYLILRPSLTREQVLFGRWSLVGRVTGQWANGPLINTEQFAIGGADTVRGYTEAERLGDTGIDGTLELRTPQLSARPRVEQAYVSLWADGGQVRILEPLPGQTSWFGIASVGLGLRFKLDGLFVGFDGARTLCNGSVTPVARWRGGFRVAYSH